MDLVLLLQHQRRTLKDFPCVFYLGTSELRKLRFELIFFITRCSTPFDPIVAYTVYLSPPN